MMVFIHLLFFTKIVKGECAKFRGLCAIVGLGGLVPLRHRDFVGISWVPNFFSLVFRGSQIFPRGISWVQSFFSWVFRGSKISSRVENFVNFSCWPHEKRWHRNISQTAYSVSNRFQ